MKSKEIGESPYFLMCVYANPGSHQSHAALHAQSSRRRGYGTRHFLEGLRGFMPLSRRLGVLLLAASNCSQLGQDRTQSARPEFAQILGPCGIRRRFGRGGVCHVLSGGNRALPSLPGSPSNRLSIAPRIRRRARAREEIAHCSRRGQSTSRPSWWSSARCRGADPAGSRLLLK